MNNQPNNQNNNQQNPNNQQRPQGNQNNTPKPVLDDATSRKQQLMKIGSALLIIVVVLALANGKWGTKPASDAPKAATELPEGCKEGFLFSETTGKPCPPPAEPVDLVAPATVVTTDTSDSVGYEEALRLYAGKVVSFDAECKALPAVATFAPGTRIMVANNSKVALTFKTLGMTKELRPYHYFLATLKDAGTTTISCNGNATSTLTVK